MKIEVKVPQLPESVSEATLLDWHVKKDDFVERGDNLIDLETDKVVMELPAEESGALVEIVASPGDSVKSGQVIAYIDTSKKAEKKADDQKDSTESKESTEATSSKKEEKSDKKDEKSAMPAAKKAMNENNLSSKEVEGTGRGGRILKEDVARTLNQKTSNRLQERVPMSKLRQRIAERLVDSQHTAAILTTFNEVNMKPIMDLRAKYKEAFQKEHGVKLGFMSFFVKAAVQALRKYPVVNAAIDGKDILYNSYFDIGIAVSSERGLVVPILRNCESMSIADIEKQILEFASQAKNGKISLDDLTGGTFTITNGGTFGSMMSTPIINPPQSAILGMHSIKDRVVAENGQMVIRPMMYLALSYDHRIIDGKEAVLTLVSIKEALEDPSRLLLDL